MAVYYPGDSVTARDVDGVGVEVSFTLADSFDGMLIDRVETVDSAPTGFTVHFDEAALNTWRRLGIDVASTVAAAADELTDNAS